jgi:enolase
VSKIKNIFAREIIDSRSTPTVEVDVVLESGAFGRSATPSGASTGSYEAYELRDGGEAFLGKGVSKAVFSVNEEIKNKLVNEEHDQTSLDRTLCELDGDPNKKRLGANGILAVSLAFARSVSAERNIHLFEYISQLTNRQPKMPTGLFNVINGGAHADSGISFQEFMVIPKNSTSWKEGLRLSVEVYNTLKQMLAESGHIISVGDEGGFAPKLKSNKEALSFLVQSIEKSGHDPKGGVAIGLDVAANELKNNDVYVVDGVDLNTDELNDYYESLIKEFPIFSIEDPFSEDNFDGFRNATSRFGSDIKIVGDDLFVTNAERLRSGINEKLANAIIIKPNQAGTLTETLDTLNLAFENQLMPIISHRSGETEDVFISHLAVGSGSPFIKSGAPARGERTAKYNELIRIEEILLAR